MTVTRPVRESVEEQVTHLRGRITWLDTQLIRLFKLRARLARRVILLRVSAGGPRLDLDRERQVINQYTDSLGPSGCQLATLVLHESRGPMFTETRPEG